MNKKIAIIIPAYNEDDNIINLINHILFLKINLKIIIVDDSKVKNKKLEKLNKIKKIKYLFRGKKMGRGSAVIAGLKFAKKNKFKTFIEMDADFSHNPNEIKRNLKYFYKSKCDLLISSRYLSNSKIINWPISRHVLSYCANKLIRMCLNIPILDFTNGFRIYSLRSVNKVVRECGKIGDGFIILSEILLKIHLSNYNISEISTIFKNRVRGESSVNIFLILQSLLGLLKLLIVKYDFSKKKLR